MALWKVFLPVREYCWLTGSYLKEREPAEYLTWDAVQARYFS